MNIQKDSHSLIDEHHQHDIGCESSHPSPTLRNRKKKNILFDRIDSSTKEDWFNKDGLKMLYQEGINNYRLTHVAANYDFAYRPFEDKMLLQKKDKKLLEMTENGIRGSPEKSKERFINKIFDHQRKRGSEAGNNEGCIQNFQVRDQVIKLGDVTACSIKAHFSHESDY